MLQTLKLFGETNQMEFTSNTPNDPTDCMELTRDTTDCMEIADGDATNTTDTLGMAQLRKEKTGYVIQLQESQDNIKKCDEKEKECDRKIDSLSSDINSFFNAYRKNMSEFTINNNTRSFNFYSAFVFRCG